MKHFLYSLVLVFLAAAPAWSAPTLTPLNRPVSVSGGILYFGANDSADSAAVGVSGFCSVRASLQGSDAVSLYAITSATTAASSGTLLKAFTASTSPSNPIYTFTASTQWVKAVATSSSTGGSTVTIECSPLFGSTGGVDAAGVDGAYMTPTTTNYLSNLKNFEGLDQTIPWTRYWIDPYSGSDANPGTYERPFKTLSKWKEMAAFGTWFTIKNGGRDRPMYVSNQTYPFPTTESCVVGETVTYDAGGSTSRILDIDVAAGKIVFETLTGGSIDAADVITGGSQSGAACAWTLGTREPSIWDAAVVGTYLCSIDNTDTCTSGQRYTTGAHCAVGTCGAAIEAAIALDDTPTRYEGRIVTILDVEDPENRPIIHGDSLSLGELDNTALGSNSDRNGLFITDHANSYGCLGVANIITEKIIDDIISQHQEGCVRALNVYSRSVLNVANALNDNVITTHGGSSGRGGVVSVNGGGVDFRYSDSAGSPVAPTGVSHMILIGGEYVTDLANTSDTDIFNIMGATGGNITAIGVDGFCKNLPALSNGCNGWAIAVSDGTSSFDFIRSVARTLELGAAASRAGISMQTSSTYSLSSKIYRSSFYSSPNAAWGIYSDVDSASGTLDIRGAIFDNLDIYMWDDSSPASSWSGTISGVYDNDGTNAWRFAGSTVTTASAADALTPINVLSDSRSIQSDVTEYTTDFGNRCAATGECWDSYDETFYVDFAEVVYDYLPVGIRGYLESGSRNYGAR